VPLLVGSGARCTLGKVGSKRAPTRAAEAPTPLRRRGRCHLPGSDKHRRDDGGQRNRDPANSGDGTLRVPLIGRHERPHPAAATTAARRSRRIRGRAPTRSPRREGSNSEESRGRTRCHPAWIAEAAAVLSIGVRTESPHGESGMALLSVSCGSRRPPSVDLVLIEDPSARRPPVGCRVRRR
jgi:hypothetical protein